MKSIQKIILLLISVFIVSITYAQDIPFVYDIENTGANYPKPPLPEFADLPIVNPLTDPFEWSDGSVRDTTFASWSHRRSEIKAEIENYEIGPKPDRPDTITANYSNDILTVNVTVNGKTLRLKSAIVLPEGDGPFPAVIGMNSGTGSLPSTIFSSRNVAQITYSHNDVTTYYGHSNTDPFYQLYPNLNVVNSGQYAPWAWGVSRIIDGLELCQDSLAIDLKHIAVTGCSYAGKMALFAGAFDERIALTISQESGGGGAAAWRVSETVGEVEKLGSTDKNWFMDSMFRFGGSNVNKLPHDHHELMAMVAPRALLVLGNPDYVWLADESGYVSCKAAQKVWDNFGISDRFGYSIVAGHGHCQLPTSQFPEVEAFVEKFLLSINTVNTKVEKSPYGNVDDTRWYEWWGNGESYFPEQFNGRTLMFEAECSILGNDWTKVSDPLASNKACIVSKPERKIMSKTKIDEASTIEIPFTLDTTGNYVVFARVNCASSDNDSYWIYMDDGNIRQKSSLVTEGWEWKYMGVYELEEGDHSLKISYRENGGLVDKICLSSFLYYEPSELGDTALNICDPKVGSNILNSTGGYLLGENYPNPFNGKTNISFNIPKSTYVSLKIYNELGTEIAELAGKKYNNGKHIVEFNSANLESGIYIYTLEAEDYFNSRKMLLNKKNSF